MLAFLKRIMYRLGIRKPPVMCKYCKYAVLGFLVSQQKEGVRTATPDDCIDISAELLLPVIRCMWISGDTPPNEYRSLLKYNSQPYPTCCHHTYRELKNINLLDNNLKRLTNDKYKKIKKSCLKGVAL